MKVFFSFLALALALIACTSEATITVKNEVHNVRLDQVRFGSIYVGSYLLTNQSKSAKYEDQSKEFPLTHQLEFVMIGSNGRSYLRTSEYYQLEENETLEIVISDSTVLIAE